MKDKIKTILKKLNPDLFLGVLMVALLSACSSRQKGRIVNDSSTDTIGGGDSTQIKVMCYESMPYEKLQNEKEEI